MNEGADQYRCRKQATQNWESFGTVGAGLHYRKCRRTTAQLELEDQHLPMGTAAFRLADIPVGLCRRVSALCVGALVPSGGDRGCLSVGVEPGRWHRSGDCTFFGGYCRISGAIFAWFRLQARPLPVSRCLVNGSGGAQRSIRT